MLLHLSQWIKYQEGKHQERVQTLQSRLISALHNYYHFQGRLKLGIEPVVKPSPHHPLSDPISHANLQRKRELQGGGLCSMFFLRLFWRPGETAKESTLYKYNYMYIWQYDSNDYMNQRPKPLASRKGRAWKGPRFLCDPLFFLRCSWQHEASMSWFDCSLSKVLVGAHMIVCICDGIPSVITLQHLKLNVLFEFPFTQVATQ